ncbi:hypothetical protein [Microvirga sp. 2TAF3]|uniref:hypothetical protein n=1 Tax=Microvirga sp. 2TAF3 TaxID=3233014 RepID=UPI003F9AF432
MLDILCPQLSGLAADGLGGPFPFRFYQPLIPRQETGYISSGIKIEFRNPRRLRPAGTRMMTPPDRGVWPSCHAGPPIFHPGRLASNA